MKNKGSFWVLIFSLLSLGFAVLVGSVIMKAFSATGNSAEVIGGAIGGMLLLPHFGTIVLGAMFGWLSVFLKANWAILTGAILLAVSLILMPTNFFLSLPIAIIGFIGYAHQKKLQQKSNEVTAEV